MKIDFGWGTIFFGGSRDLPGRNDPCPCGSGAKFKKCDHPVPEHLQVTEEELEAYEREEDARHAAVAEAISKLPKRPHSVW